MFKKSYAVKRVAFFVFRDESSVMMITFAANVAKTHIHIAFVQFDRFKLCKSICVCGV
jgi:hypothetical protein